jgi:F0F1-type ATP synthase membrane subunit c/vacuolar-type H+-ATPase subunit K
MIINIIIALAFLSTGILIGFILSSLFIMAAEADKAIEEKAIEDNSDE